MILDLWNNAGFSVNIGFLLVKKAIWKTRNKMCFKDKSVQDPAYIVCYACALMSYWAGLYLNDDKEALVAGVNTMLKIAMQLTKKKQKSDDQKLLEDNGGSSGAT